MYFEDPFWVGVVEWQADGALHAARHVFGAEPSPGEVLEFIQHQLGPPLDRPGVALAWRRARHTRAAARALAERGVSTQSQMALRLQLEQNKHDRTQHGKAEREAEAAYMRQRKIEKAKARHRGR